jgi:hypothetical protein
MSRLLMLAAMSTTSFLSDSKRLEQQAALKQKREQQLHHVLW